MYLGVQCPCGSHSPDICSQQEAGDGPIAGEVPVRNQPQLVAQPVAGHCTTGNLLSHCPEHVKLYEPIVTATSNICRASKTSEQLHEHHHVMIYLENQWLAK